MNEHITWSLSVLWGCALGAVFFGGLWWTVRKGTSSSWAAAWFLVSFVLRMGVALGGFYAVGREHWDRMLFCLAGFMIARLMLTRILRSLHRVPGKMPKEARHAS